MTLVPAREAARSRGRCAACRGSPAHPRTRTRSLALLIFIDDLGIDDVLILIRRGALGTLRTVAGAGPGSRTRGLILGVEGLTDLLAGGGQLVLGGLDRLDVRSEERRVGKAG